MQGNSGQFRLNKPTVAEFGFHQFYQYYCCFLSFCYCHNITILLYHSITYILSDTTTKMKMWWDRWDLNSRSPGLSWWLACLRPVSHDLPFLVYGKDVRIPALKSPAQSHDVMWWSVGTTEPTSTQHSLPVAVFCRFHENRCARQDSNLCVFTFQIGSHAKLYHWVTGTVSSFCAQRSHAQALMQLAGFEPAFSKPPEFGEIVQASPKLHCGCWGEDLNLFFVLWMRPTSVGCNWLIIYSMIRPLIWITGISYSLLIKIVCLKYIYALSRWKWILEIWLSF